MDGRAARRAIRVDGRLAHLPVLALTASLFPDGLIAANAAGMNSHIEKHSAAERLLDVLASGWRRADVRRGRRSGRRLLGEQACLPKGAAHPLQCRSAAAGDRRYAAQSEGTLRRMQQVRRRKANAERALPWRTYGSNRSGSPFPGQWRLTLAGHSQRASRRALRSQAE